MGHISTPPERRIYPAAAGGGLVALPDKSVPVLRAFPCVWWCQDAPRKWTGRFAFLDRSRSVKLRRVSDVTQILERVDAPDHSAFFVLPFLEISA